MVLLAFSWRIIYNEYHLYRLTRQIAGEKSDNIILAHYVEELHERTAVTELLCLIAGKRLSSDMLLRISDIIYSNSTQFGYDPLLLLAVIEVESVFRPDALGKYRSGDLSGALGLMQLKMATAQEMASLLQMDSLKEGDLFKPEINVILGAAYLTTMISRFKSFKLGLLAYNQGPGVIQKQLSEKSPLSVHYYQKVLHSYYFLKRNATRLAAGDDQKPMCQ
jgi:soluble lytic murein transglycosylase